MAVSAERELAQPLDPAPPPGPAAVPRPVPPATARSARLWAWSGLVLIAVSVVAIAVLHIWPPASSLDPMARTLSEYALLPDGWLFNASVIVLAVASAFVLVALVLLGLIRPRSLGGIAIGIWCLALIGLIVFPKHKFGIETTLASRVHWTWTLVALFALPLGAVAACWGRLGRLPRWVIGLCAFAASWFAVLTVQTVLGAVTNWKLWAWVGGIERVLSGTEIAVVALLACWALATGRSTLAASRSGRTSR